MKLDFVSCFFLVLLTGYLSKASGIISPEKMLDSGWYFQQRGITDSSLIWYKKVIVNPKASDRIKGQAHLNMANIWSVKGDYYASIEENILAKNYFELCENTAKIFHCIRNIALNYNGLGLYQTSIDYLFQAELILNDLNDPKLNYLQSISTGRVYEELSEYNEALKKYLIANHIAAKNDLTNEFNGSLVSIGNIYFGQELMDSALIYYRWAHRASELAEDNTRLSYTSNNIGKVFLKQGSLDSAHFYLNKALLLKQKYSPSRLPSTHIALSEYWLKVGDQEQAFILLLEAAQRAKEQNDIELLLESYEMLKNYHQQVGDYKKALFAMEKLDSLRTHRFNSEKLAVNKLKASYDLQKKDDQIALKESQLKQEQLIRWLMVIAALVVLMVAIVFYRLYKTNLRLKRKNEVLLKEQNHRVKNNLQMISSLLSLQSLSLPSPEAKGALSESQARINSVALLHRMLYEGEELGKVELVDYLKSLTEEVKYAVPRTLTLSFQMPAKVMVEIETATSLGLIVNELMTNSVKHVPKTIGLSITLEIKMLEGELKLFYHDNGPGVELPTWEGSSSFGNQLIRIQCQQLRGNYQMECSDGFSFILTLKR